jgi:hypothetical protein
MDAILDTCAMVSLLGPRHPQRMLSWMAFEGGHASMEHVSGLRDGHVQAYHHVPSESWEQVSVDLAFQETGRNRRNQPPTYHVDSQAVVSPWPT